MLYMHSNPLGPGLGRGETICRQHVRVSRNASKVLGCDTVPRGAVSTQKWDEGSQNIASIDTPYTHEYGEKSSHEASATEIVILFK